MTTNSYGSRNQTYDQSKFSKFSRHGATTLQSGTGKDVDLQELRPKEMGALVRNQVYLGDTAGVKAYGQNNRKLGNGAGAEGGVRDSTVIKDWFEENVKDDQVVVTTKIDVDYGAASPGMPNYRHPGSPGMAMNYQPNTSTQDLLRRRDQRNDQRTNSVGGMTFFNARESV